MTGRVEKTLVWLLASALAAGCADTAGKPRAGGARVTASSEPTAATAITSESGRFALALPGPSWKLLHPPEARKLVGDALAGALSASGVSAVVLLRRAGADQLEASTRRLIARLALADAEVEERGPLKVAGGKGRRIAVVGTAGGVALRYVAHLLARGGRTYELLAWGARADQARDAPDFDAFFGAVKLRAGPLGPAPEALAPPDAAGADWRVREGVLSSAAGGYQLSPQRGWRLVVGQPAMAINPEADALLVGQQHDGSITLWSEPATATVPPTSAEVPREPHAEPPSEAVRFNLAGAAARLQRDSAGGELLSRARQCRAGRCVVIDARQPAGAAEPSPAELESALKGLTWLPDAEVGKLDAELGREFHDGAVGTDYCLRGGVLRDFAHSVRFKSPSPDWRVYAAERARARLPAASVFIEQRRLGLRGALLIEQPVGLEGPQYHQRVVDRMEARFGFSADSAKAKLGGIEALVSEGDAQVEGAARRYRCWTAVHARRAYQLVVWGPPATISAQAGRLEAVAAGFELRGVEAVTELKADAYRDNRLGFEVSLPPQWHLRDRTPVALAPVGTFIEWGWEGRWLGVVAASLAGEGHDEAWYTAWLEQLLREQLGPLARGDAEAGQASLAGRSARRVRWAARLQHIDALLLRRGRVLFAVMAVDHDDTAFDAVSRGFRLLD